MNCTQCKKLINTYLDGYLSGESEREMFRHIEACPQCTRYYEEISTVFDRLEDPDVEVPRGFRYAWQDEIARAAHKKRRPNYKVLIPALAACACGVVLVSVMVFGAGGYNASGGNVLGQAFSLDYAAQPAQQQGERQPAGTVTSEQQGSFELPDTQNEVQQPGASAKNGAGKLVEGNAQQQGGGAQTQPQNGADAQAQNQPEAGETAPAFGGFAQGADPAADAQGGAVMPQIERKEANGEVRYVLDARELNLSKALVIEYAKSLGVNVTETENGVIVEEEPGVLEGMLRAYNIDAMDGMSRLEIILE